ncbi:MAG: 50S ribosomal protein L29 [Gammaproteobacteria bacterium]|nr:MAG: 50S ribosomal protein L29 [Gammaproteobacteria bacterium]|tara:strand:- start:28 stop:246 length:219 start_codon:yes stop_codon:yes gene_type:complete
MAKKKSILSGKKKSDSASSGGVNELKKELLELRLALSLGQANNFHKIKELRKAIARVKTSERINLEAISNDK